MPRTVVQGVGIEYEILGDEGPWLMLVQPNRQDKELYHPLAEYLAAAGYRVILHDRRNSGGSEISFDDYAMEDEIFADDVHELCSQLGASPVIACGGAGGSRQAILMTLRHPGSTKALLLWWPTGGRPAAENLADFYYGQYLRLIEEGGGMEAIAETPYFAERIRRDPSNRERILQTSVHDFVRKMKRWQEGLLDGADLPVIGVQPETLSTITQPACIIAGYDTIHPRQIAETLVELLPNSELHEVPPLERPEDEEARQQARRKHQRDLADTFIAFLREHPELRD